VFTKMENFQRIKTSIKWFLALPRVVVIVLFDFRGPRSKRYYKILGARRFLVLTPQIFDTQIIYDRARKKFIKIYIRDSIDLAVMKQIFINHDYGLYKLSRAQALKEYYEKIISNRKIPLIIDCGSNSGMSIRYFKETYEDAQIVGIEPDVSNVKLAIKNNFYNQAILRTAAIGNSEAKVNIQNKNDSHWAYQVKQDINGDVEVITINNLLKEFGQNAYQPFIVKIDIEGFECNLFENNVEWIDSFPILIIELHDWMLPKQANSNNFLKAISKRNRDFFFMGRMFLVSQILLIEMYLKTIIISLLNLRAKFT